MSAVTEIMEPYDTRLRPITQADAVQVAELEGLLFPDSCWNERTIVDLLELGDGWLTEHENLVTGYALVQRQSNLLDLIRIGVHPVHQRRGLGSKLLEMALATNPAMLTVAAGNPAIHLYHAHGFRVVGALDGAWVMRRATSA